MGYITSHDKPGSKSANFISQDGCSKWMQMGYMTKYIWLSS